MENWIIQVLGWIGAFILGVLVNLVTPSIKTFFQRSYLSLRERNIRGYRDEYQKLKTYKDDQPALIVELIRRMTVALGFIMILIGLSVSTLVSGFRGNFQDNFLNSPVFYGVFMGYIVSKLMEIPSLIDRVAHVEDYKIRTNKILMKWGVSLEDDGIVRNTKRGRKKS